MTILLVVYCTRVGQDEPNTFESKSTLYECRSVSSPNEMRNYRIILLCYINNKQQPTLGAAFFIYFFFFPYVTAGASNATTTTNGMRAATVTAAAAVGNNNTSSVGTAAMAAADQQQQGGGTPVRMLQLDGPVIQAIADRCRSVRPEQTAVVEVAATVPAAELPADGYAIDGGRTVGHVCAKCQLAFPDNGGLAAHQQQQCRTTGSVALAHPAYGCRSCGVGANGETNTYGTVHALRAHIEAAHHYPATATARQQQPPNLSDEMEDVVNQITALAAAKAVGRSPSPRDHPSSDSNANLFCAPTADKKPGGSGGGGGAKAHNKFTVPANAIAPVPSGGQ